MSDRKPTFVVLPDDVRRMAGMAAARAGLSLSEYVAELIRKDADDTGIARLVEAEEVTS